MAESEKIGFIMSDSLYTKAKWTVQIALPAFSAFYFSMAQIWGIFPAAEEVVGTCAVAATFVGALIGISGKNYDKAGLAYDGKVVTTHTDEGGIQYSLELDDDPAVLETKDHIAFKVEQADVLPDDFDFPG